MSETEEPRYRAFISYSHADKACAEWLHRALESYRIPVKLVGRATAVGTVPPRLTPIFKDRDELPASGDLSNELRAALDASQFLIVIASPAAASSRWVNEEIRAFKQGRGDANVLTLIAAGEPGMSAVPGREAEECFPEALRHRVDADGRITDVASEPIAADIRPDGDGKRLAKLKLVAGLTGLDLDSLVQRETQRRGRRMTALTVFATLVAMIMTTLSVVALRARDEAERQRAEADGLVEYMLTELRGKLEPVGRLDVLDSVGARALKYYAGQKPGDLDADALGRRARALHLVGEVSNLRGDLTGALRTFEAAAASTEEQLRRDPSDGQRVFDHAQSVYWVGYIDWQRGRLDRAEREMRRYLALAEQLAALGSDRPDWRMELAYAHGNLGAVLLERNRAADAADAYARAIKVAEALAAAAPRDPVRSREVASLQSWLAKALERQGLLAEARAERLRQLRRLDVILAAHPGNSDAREDRVVALQHSAQLALSAGDMAMALDAGALAIADAERLIRLEPENTRWQENLGRAHALRAETLIADGQNANAAPSVERAERLVAQLIRSDASVADWSGLLQARCLMLRARMAASASDFVRAQRLARSASLALNRAYAQGARDVEVRRLWAAALTFEGDLLMALSNPRAANALWRAALREASAGVADPDLKAIQNQALERLRQDPAALRSNEGLLGSAIANPLYARLGVEPVTPISGGTDAH